MDDVDPREYCERTGKRIFRSEGAAKARMRPLRGSRHHRRRLRDSLRAYQCPHCHGWHLTNPEKA